MGGAPQPAACCHSVHVSETPARVAPGASRFECMQQCAALCCALVQAHTLAGTTISSTGGMGLARVVWGHIHGSSCTGGYEREPCGAHTQPALVPCVVCLPHTDGHQHYTQSSGPGASSSHTLRGAWCPQAAPLPKDQQQEGELKLQQPPSPSSGSRSVGWRSGSTSASELHLPHRQPHQPLQVRVSSRLQLEPVRHPRRRAQPQPCFNLKFKTAHAPNHPALLITRTLAQKQPARWGTFIRALSRSLLHPGSARTPAAHTRHLQNAPTHTSSARGWAPSPAP